MVGIGSRGSSSDYSRAIQKNPKLISEMNFKKGVRRPADQVAHEDVIEGVTSDSIAEFVASRKDSDERKNPAGVVQPAPTGLFTRLARIFRR